MSTDDSERMLGCGSTINNGRAFVGNDDGIVDNKFRPFPDNDYCNMPCQGDFTEICGGPNRINIYQFAGSFGGKVVNKANGWKSQGCFR